MGASPSVVLTTTLDPLPPDLRQGLPAVAFFGLLSLISSTGLFLFLTARLIKWYRKGHLKNCNQFWILVYNLLLADIQQAMAFALTTVYVAKNKIEVGTTTCWANGWFVSTGDLASGVFIFTIALHTFLSLVKQRSINDRAFYCWLALCWTFVYLMAIVTVCLRKNIYVRAGAWCWIDREFESERLWLHYIWIFIAMFGTVVIYAFTYLSIYSRLSSSTTEVQTEVLATKRAAKYMIIYPVVYVVCTLPLAGGRMAAMTGVRVPYWYFCLAGSAITSCGWLDVLLYALTRRVLIFSSDPPPKDTFGFDTFGSYSNGFYGTRTVIEGPRSRNKKSFERHKGSKFSVSGLRSLKKRHSDEDYFATPSDGVIMTKTTVEITSGPIFSYAPSENSAMELDDKHGTITQSLSR